MGKRTKKHLLPDGRELVQLSPVRGMVIDGNSVEFVEIEEVDMPSEETAPCTPSEPDQAP